MPGRAHAVHLREGGDVAGRGKPTHGADVHAHKIDEPLLDDRCPLVRVSEQLSHRQRRGTLLADIPEPGDVFRRQGVLQEEQLERLRLLGKAYGLDWLQALVDIVQELDLEAQLTTQVLEATPEMALLSTGPLRQ